MILGQSGMIWLNEAGFVDQETEFFSKNVISSLSMTSDKEKNAFWYNQLSHLRKTYMPIKIYHFTKSQNGRV